MLVDAWHQQTRMPRCKQCNCAFEVDPYGDQAGGFCNTCFDQKLCAACNGRICEPPDWAALAEATGDNVRELKKYFMEDLGEEDPFRYIRGVSCSTCGVCHHVACFYRAVGDPEVGDHCLGFMDE